jgi:hypothetical protein
LIARDRNEALGVQAQGEFQTQARHFLYLRVLIVFVSRSDQDVTSAAELFDLLWESLADVVGTAATATLLRRAIKQASSQTSWSEPITVARNGLDYEYRLPETWKQPGNEEAIGAFRVVAAELRVLLVELTGPVVVRRLARLAPFRKLGIDFDEEEK